MVSLAEGTTVTLCPAMVVRVLEAAQSAKWSADDTSRLLAAIQRRLDGRPAPQIAELEELVATIRPDTDVQQLIATMERAGTRSATR